MVIWGLKGRRHGVAGLRKAGQMTVSLVAEMDGEIVGHVPVSPVSISDGTPGWYCPGPVSVAPEFQGKGIGTQLGGNVSYHGAFDSKG